MARSNGITRGGTDEESSLLGKTDKASSLARRLQKHMTVNVSRNWGDMLLLSCYIITGLLDSSAVFIWGAFVSMQTGNTIYLGLGLVDPGESDRWIKSIISILSFCVGSAVFGAFHRWCTPRRRWVLVTSFLVQSLLIVAAALIVMLGKDVKNGLHWQVAVPLACVAFSSSGQAVTSRVLKFNSMTTVVLTSTYCDFFSDPKLFARDNPERNRRAVAPVLLLTGAIFGGLWSHSSIGLAGALWTGAVLKAAVMVAWLFWAAETEDDAEEDS